MLQAVSTWSSILKKGVERGKNVRVRTSVGHGEETRLVVIELEVLVGELLTVDGLAASTLIIVSINLIQRKSK